MLTGTGTLVSNEIFREILPSNCLGPGRGEVVQGGLKVLRFWCHSQKSALPNQKIFRECKLQDLLSLLSFWPGL